MIQNKWGKIILEHGWVPIPINLLRLQPKLGINSTDMLILINLIAYWRNSNDPIYPSQESLAKNLGVTKRTVQRSIRKLEDKNLVITSPTLKKDSIYFGRNIYDITPLIIKMNFLLEESND